MTRAEKIRRALRLGRRYVKADLDMILESHCLLKKGSLKPDLATLEEEAKPWVAARRRALKQIDELLK
jgi:hypothetical protein